MQNTAKQNYPAMVQSPFTTLAQETKWTYFTTLPSPHWMDNKRVYHKTNTK